VTPAQATPAQIESEIRRLARKLEDRTDELAGLFRGAAEADVAYRLAYAKALLVADGDTVSAREAHATLTTAELLLDRKVAEAVADAGRESVRSMRDQLSAVQSVGAMLRAQMDLAR
jgi:hypothetical protein